MLLLPLAPDRAEAHEIQPSIATLSFGADSYRISITVNLEAIVAEIGPQHTDTSQSANAARYDSLRDLPPDEWERRFFGAYTHTLPVYREWFQDDLRAAFEKDGAVAPLPFAVGYHSQIGEGCLILANRRESP